MSEGSVLTFGRFRLDKAAGRLLDDGGPIALTPKALALGIQQVRPTSRS
jgi:hypothetical protein